jgi:hypothetical protein
MRIEGEKATVCEVLTTRPAGGDTKARLRYFYTPPSCAETIAGRYPHPVWSLWRRGALRPNLL